MTQAFFRFYAELNDLLAPKGRQRPASYRLNGPVAVKHAIEAQGIPHTEVDLILANGRPVDFSYPVQPGDRLSVYPFFQEIDLAPLPALRAALPSPPRFVIDNHLGRLAVFLRLLGFDALYRNDFDDVELAQVSSEENRVLLTRDRRLLMRKVVVYGYCVRTRDPRRQLVDVIRRYRLNGLIRPWQRCLRCNGDLRPVAKEEIIERLEPKTKKYFFEFQRCGDCQQIYWKGSHYEPLRHFIESIQERTRSLRVC
jgi:uncharacterized protein with PIN domain